MKAKSHTTVERYYSAVLSLLEKSRIPYLIGGAFALREYTGIFRDTKDLDLFTKPSDYPKILKVLQDAGYQTEITDARWLAKAYQKDYLVDVIFSSPSGVCTVDDTWFEHATAVKLLTTEVKVLAAEDLIWCKAYVQNRIRFDGADIHHVFLRKGKTLNWRYLLHRMEPHWEVLLAHILTFRFVYPSERNTIPEAILKDLLARVAHQFEMPIPKDKICRGHVISRMDYDIDIKEWQFKDVT